MREAPEAKEVEYVLYIDADMLLRKPMDPIAMGVRRGVVVSEHVGYLDVGPTNPNPNPSPNPNPKTLYDLRLLSF